MSKREREEGEAQVLLILENESPPCYCYTAPLSLFTESDLEALSGSLPSDRKAGPLKGCLSEATEENLWSELDQSVWTPVDRTSMVWSLEHVRRVVMAYQFE